jgi:hypothetical protein
MQVGEMVDSSDSEARTRSSHYRPRAASKLALVKVVVRQEAHCWLRVTKVMREREREREREETTRKLVVDIIFLVYPPCPSLGEQSTLGSI